MKRIIFTILTIAIFCFAAVKTFAQCSCVPKLTLQEHFQRSEVVFIGKVVEAKKVHQENADRYDIIIKFEVKQSWKRDLERVVVVIEPNGSTDGFEPNTEWLLYALKSDDGMLQIVRGCCSRTKPLPVATKQGDLKGFKKMGEKPKKIIDS